MNSSESIKPKVSLKLLINTFQPLFKIEKAQEFLGRKRNEETFPLVETPNKAECRKNKYYLYHIEYKRPPLWSNESDMTQKYQYTYNKKYAEIMRNVACFIVSDDGLLLITMCHLNFIRLWDLEEPYDYIDSLSIDPTIKYMCKISNNRLLGYSIAKRIIVWSLESFVPISTIKLDHPAYYFRVLDEGRVLVDGYSVNSIWNTEGNELKFECKFYIDEAKPATYNVSQLKRDEFIYGINSDIVIYSTTQRKQSTFFSHSPIKEIIKSKYLDLCVLYSNKAIGVLNAEYELKTIELYSMNGPDIVNMLEMSRGVFACASTIGTLSIIEVEPFQIRLTCYFWKEHLTLLKYLNDGRLIIDRVKEKTIYVINYLKPKGYTCRWVDGCVNRKQLVQLPNGKLVFLIGNNLHILE